MFNEFISQQNFRVNEWKTRLEEKAHACLVNLYEDLATGHDIPWLNWRCLNRLRTGYTCSKEQKKKGRYFNVDTTCEYGEHVSHVAMLTPRTPLLLGRPSRVQRYSSIMHRAMEKDSLMTRYDGEWNANGIGNKQTELSIFLEAHNVKVAAIKESKITAQSRSPNIQNYTLV